MDTNPALDLPSIAAPAAELQAELAELSLAAKSGIANSAITSIGTTTAASLSPETEVEESKPRLAEGESESLELLDLARWRAALPRPVFGRFCERLEVDEEDEEETPLLLLLLL